MASVTPGERGDPSLSLAQAHRRLRIAAYAVVLVLLVAVAGWVSTHPDGLPTSGTRVDASTPVDVPVYLGVFAPGAGFGRSLHVSGVRVFATSTVDVTILPHLCRGGSVNVTTTPDSFCAELVGTQDSAFAAGDEIVLEVRGAEPGVVDIDRVRVAYRDGLQWAVQDAGAPARVTILAR
jgi:hypothetical protein